MDKETKLTRKDSFEILRGLVEVSDVENKDELVAFIDNEVGKLVRKASKPTKAQKENEPLKEAVLEVLAKAGTPLAVKDVQEAVGVATNQKATALLTALVKEHKVVKTVDKKKSFYSTVTE